MKHLVVIFIAVISLSGCLKPKSIDDGSGLTFIAGGTAQNYVPSYTLPPEYVEYAQDVSANKELSEYYDQYNVQYFNGVLPTNTVVKCNDFPESVDAQGLTARSPDKQTIVILIADRFCKGERVYLPILLHEMVHVEYFDDPELQFDAHGPKFQKEMHRLMEDHAFDNLW